MAVGLSMNYRYATSSNKRGGHVTAWFLTHPHPDHIGAFNRIYANPEDIIIDKIYATDIDYDLYMSYAQPWDDFNTFNTFCLLTSSANNVYFLHTGDILSFPGMTIEVYNAYEDSILNYSTDLANQSSLVFKIIGNSESMLFCGDIYGETICNYLINCYNNQLESTYLQMGHHGNNSLTPSFISNVNPKAAFFDAPQWLIEGENYDTQKNITIVESLGAQTYTYMTAPNQCILH